MQMIEHRLFPTLVGKFENVLFPSQCNEYISYLKQDSLKQYNALSGDALSTFDKGHLTILKQFPHDMANILKMKIQYCIDQFTLTYKTPKVSLTNMWVSYQYPNSKLVKHTHPGSIISGVLYLRADELSSPIYFYNHNPFAIFTSKTTEESDFIREKIKFHPKTGDILLFPSWLAHGSDVEENMSEERIILSFNTSED
jgi:uncharacterized protein (TIGR02466 family)